MSQKESDTKVIEEDARGFVKSYHPKEVPLQKESEEKVVCGLSHQSSDANGSTMLLTIDKTLIHNN